MVSEIWDALEWLYADLDDLIDLPYGSALGGERDAQITIIAPNKGKQ